MNSSRSEHETYVLLKYGRPDFKLKPGQDKYQGRSDFLCSLPEEFIIQYRYLIYDEIQEKWRALDKCLYVSEEDIIQELVEFHKGSSTI